MSSVWESDPWADETEPDDLIDDDDAISVEELEIDLEEAEEDDFDESLDDM